MHAPPIQPAVVAGGKSRRFGRDKLAESLAPNAPNGTLLIDAPIHALREVFGPRVALVGDCSHTLRDRADLHWPDAYPGAGPAGGLLTALERAHTDVLLLAGDLPHIRAATIRAILDAAHTNPRALAVLASSPRPEPCIALYRAAFTPLLRERLSRGLLSLHDACPADSLALAPIDPADAANVNSPADLGDRGTLPP